MLRSNEAEERLAAEALMEGIDGYDHLDLLPALCRRKHLGECRREVLRRADRHMVSRRELPRA
jgi:hypothetical protein